MKICSVEAELYHVDKRTEVTKLIVAFCNFAKARKKYNYCKAYYKTKILCIKLDNYLFKYNETHGQQNVKCLSIYRNWK